MGALVSFELARFLRREHSVEPAGLFPSGRPAPQLPIDVITYNLPEKEFIEDIGGGRHARRSAGPSGTASASAPDSARGFSTLPDLQYKHEPPLKSAVTVYGGLNDQFGDRRDSTCGANKLRDRSRCACFPAITFSSIAQIGFCLRRCRKICSRSSPTFPNREEFDAGAIAIRNLSKAYPGRLNSARCCAVLLENNPCKHCATSLST